MKKSCRLILAVLLLPLLIPFVQAASSFVGGFVTLTAGTNNIGTVSGSTVTVSGTFPLPTGAATSANQTTEISYLSILQSTVAVHIVDSLSVTGSTIQVTGLNGGAVAVSAASLPLPTGAATSALQTTGNNYLSILQSTVAVHAADLPPGAATSAKQDTGNTSLASIDSKITAVNTGAVTISAALPTGTNSIGTVYLSPVATPTTSSVTVTSAVSVQVLAADANRKTYSIYSYPTNTDFIVCHWGAGAATLTSEVILAMNSNTVPTGAVETLALQCIANGGSQVLRAVSWDQ